MAVPVSFALIDFCGAVSKVSLVSQNSSHKAEWMTIFTHMGIDKCYVHFHACSPIDVHWDAVVAWRKTLLAI